MNKKKMNLEDIKSAEVEILKADAQKQVKGGDDLVVIDDIAGF